MSDETKEPHFIVHTYGQVMRQVETVRRRWPQMDIVWQFVPHDLERIHPPESDDERAQRHERLALYHWQEFTRLTGKEPEQRKPDGAVRLDADDKARLKYAQDCVMMVLQHERASGGVVNGEPTEHVRTVERLSSGALATLNRLVAHRSTEPAPTLTAEDVARLRGAFGEWMRDRLGDDEMADAIRTVLAKMEGR